MAATYSPATLKRCRTILRNADTPKARVRKAQPAKAQRDPNAWRSRKASQSQMQRVWRNEERLGMDFSPANLTAGEASDWYQHLKSL